MSRGALPGHRPDQVLEALLEVTTILAKDMARFASAHQMSEARLHLLWELHCKDGLKQRELAERLRVTPRTITGLVDALVSSGHVARTAHPTDRRSTLVILTDVGRDFATDLSVMRSSLADLLLADLSPAVVRALAQALPVLATRLRNLVDDEHSAAGLSA